MIIYRITLSQILHLKRCAACGKLFVPNCPEHTLCMECAGAEEDFFYNSPELFAGKTRKKCLSIIGNHVKRNRKYRRSKAYRNYCKAQGWEDKEWYWD